MKKKKKNFLACDVRFSTHYAIDPGIWMRNRNLKKESLITFNAVKAFRKVF